MTVSRRVPYAWTCIACHGPQQSVVWVVVHEWERPDVLAEGPLAPGFVQVVCTRCGTASTEPNESNRNLSGRLRCSSGRRVSTHGTGPIS